VDRDALHRHGGAADHGFILCAMLGFWLCPRLRDLPDRKLAISELATFYKDLAPLIGRRLRSTSPGSTRAAPGPDSRHVDVRPTLIRGTGGRVIPTDALLAEVRR
jgi:hypothetical protein